MIVTKTPNPVPFERGRVYLDRGLTLATFGLMDSQQPADRLSLPASLKVAVQLKSGAIIEARGGQTMHCQLLGEVLALGHAGEVVDSQGWTVAEDLREYEVHR